MIRRLGSMGSIVCALTAIALLSASPPGYARVPEGRDSAVSRDVATAVSVSAAVTIDFGGHSNYVNVSPTNCTIPVTNYSDLAFLSGLGSVTSIDADPEKTHAIVHVKGATIRDLRGYVPGLTFPPVYLGNVDIELDSLGAVGFRVWRTRDPKNPAFVPDAVPWQQSHGPDGAYALYACKGPIVIK